MCNSLVQVMFGFIGSDMVLHNNKKKMSRKQCLLRSAALRSWCLEPPGRVQAKYLSYAPKIANQHELEVIVFNCLTYGFCQQFCFYKGMTA